MKILFVLGSRGEWGYIKPLIKELIKNNIQYAICATNMILLKENGSLINEIESEGFNVTSRILMSLEGSTNMAMAKSTGLFSASFVVVFPGNSENNVEPTDPTFFWHFQAMLEDM